MVQFESVGFQYSRKTSLFESLSFTMKPASIVGLLGRNGAGKTTLLKLMAGFLKPKTGLVRVSGKNPFDREVAFLDSIAFVPEDFKLPDIRIQELAHRYGCFYSGFSGELFLDLVRDFDLAPDARLSRISFGQQKKAYLAFCVAIRPSVLILDEPMNALDIPGKQRLRTLLLKHMPEQSLILISTHQVREISNLVGSVMILDQGRVLLHAEMAEIAAAVRMTHETAKPPEQSVIHTEPALGGFAAIAERGAAPETEIDLEVLFNAVIAHPDRFQKMLTQEAAHA